DDGRVTPIVHHEGVSFCALEIPRKVDGVTYVATPPSIECLIIVSDCPYCCSSRCQCLQELHLGFVDVLKFVNERVLDPGFDELLHLIRISHNLQSAGYKIGEIEVSSPDEFIFVCLVMLGCKAQNG